MVDQMFRLECCNCGDVIDNNYFKKFGFKICWKCNIDETLTKEEIKDNMFDRFAKNGVSYEVKYKQ
jgi:hypothetical protein